MCTSMCGPGKIFSSSQYSLFALFFNECIRRQHDHTERCSFSFFLSLTRRTCQLLYCHTNIRIYVLYNAHEHIFKEREKWSPSTSLFLSIKELWLTLGRVRNRFRSFYFNLNNKKKQISKPAQIVVCALCVRVRARTAEKIIAIARSLNRPNHRARDHIYSNQFTDKAVRICSHGYGQKRCYISMACKIGAFTQAFLIYIFLLVKCYFFSCCVKERYLGLGYRCRIFNWTLLSWPIFLVANCDFFFV